MKKITILLFLFSVNIALSQVFSTGEVSLQAGSNFTVQFDIDIQNDMVTMTMTGNTGVWYAVSPGVSPGNSMGDPGDDAIVYSDAGLEDRNMTGSFAPPLEDASQDWTLVSDNVDGNLRTIIATRSIDTGDMNDFVFPTSETSFPVLWAVGNAEALTSGHASRGGTVIDIALLSVSDFEMNALDFSIYPNPTSRELNISFSNNNQNDVMISIFDVLGKEVHTISNIVSKNNVIDVGSWTSGVYMIKVFNDNRFQVKRFIKN